MKPIFYLAAICTFLFTAASYGADNKVIPSGAKLFITEMDGDLDGYIRAEITKKGLPLKLVLQESDADLVMIGSSTEKDRKWHEGWLTSVKDHAQGNVSIVNPKEKTIVWSSEAGDRSLWKGSMSRGGDRKVAERLVGNLKKAIK